MLKDTLKRFIKLSPIALTKNHRYDKQTKKIIDELADGSNSIDVGCYKGEILDLILKRSPNGQHFGIEALPGMAKDLMLKYEGRANVEILNFAASDAVGEISYNYVVSNPSYSGMLKREYDKPDEKDKTIQVQARRLDGQIPKDIQIDIIKIDVEGAEFQVLSGAEEIVRRNKPLVVFEHGLGASNIYETTPKMIWEYFDDMEMKISNLGSYLKRGHSLSLEDFRGQYEEGKNHYFIAHT